MMKKKKSKKKTMSSMAMKKQIKKLEEDLTQSRNLDHEKGNVIKKVMLEVSSLEAGRIQMRDQLILYQDQLSQAQQLEIDLLRDYHKMAKVMLKENSVCQSMAEEVNRLKRKQSPSKSFSFNVKSAGEPVNGCDGEDFSESSNGKD